MEDFLRVLEGFGMAGEGAVKALTGPGTAEKVSARASYTSSYVKVSRPCLAGGTRILTLGGPLV